MLGDSNSTSQAAAATTTSEPVPLVAREGEGEGESDSGVNFGQQDDDDGGERESFAMEGRDGRGGGEGERSSGGNRWPREETVALLRIRMEMDAAFKEASVKGPLWEDVSRKLGELGYHRNAKKCREKFENVSKYHKRTKEGRTGKSEGKTYRFFDQLEAFESQSSARLLPPQPQMPPSRGFHFPAMSAAVTMELGGNQGVPAMGGASVTVPSSAITTPPPSLHFSIPTYPPGNIPTAQPIPPPPRQIGTQRPSLYTNFSFPVVPTELMSDSSSSSTSLDVDIGRRQNKRKWKDFFEKLLREVIQKQEDMQRRFLEALQKREQERMIKEEAWRMQELARINREREILSHERSISAAKDAAFMTFLHQHHHILGLPPPPQSLQPSPASTAHMIPQKQPLIPESLLTQLPPPLTAATTIITSEKSDSGDPSPLPSTSSSRWPKAEVQSLIQLRSNLDVKYQESGSKGPLWEEISSSMRMLGYSRSAKRCKEKWENINKYFKKVKESNKARPEDSKTCPYFHQLDALYKEKNKTVDAPSSSIYQPETSVPLLVQPEQQWPPPPSKQQEIHDEDTDKENDEDEDEAGVEI